MHKGDASPNMLPGVFTLKSHAVFQRRVQTWDGRQPSIRRHPIRRRRLFRHLVRAESLSDYTLVSCAHSHVGHQTGASTRKTNDNIAVDSPVRSPAYEHWSVVCLTTSSGPLYVDGDREDRCARVRGIHIMMMMMMNIKPLLFFL